jgi:hypothetical protein
LTDRNNAIWDINALFDAVFLFQSNTCKDEKAYKAASEPYTVPNDKIRKILGITESIVPLSKHTFTPFHLGLAV